MGALIGKGMLINKTLVRVWEIWGEGRSLKEAVSEGATALVPLIFYKFWRRKCFGTLIFHSRERGLKSVTLLLWGLKFKLPQLGKTGADIKWNGQFDSFTVSGQVIILKLPLLNIKTCTINMPTSVISIIVSNNVPVKSIWCLFLPRRERIWSPLIGGGEFDC